MSVFYEVKGVPVHSCLMLEDRQTACNYPRRDLSLGFCRVCGFISNVAFDPEVHQYSQDYEDQQSFSPRFRRFQSELVARLIDKFGVRNKHVVEIGCGKGDFLVELCITGANRGVGVDPSATPDRLSSEASQRVRLIADFYSQAYADLPCDFLCCRHTLEHIQDTKKFVGLVRDVVGDRPETLVFFEVPDVSRVLREHAFWDIYYEHCSYFTLGSLSRVFRANRFDVVDLAKDYDDQYLIIVARPTDDLSHSSLAPENDLGRVAHEVAEFSERVQRRIDGWRDRLRSLREQGKRAAVWGSGSKCVSFLSTVGAGEEVEAVVDINPHRHGKYLPGSGRRVVGPEHLRNHRPDEVFVMNPIYLDEISEQLADLGVSAELVPV